jgi:hypothetical protein
MRPTTFAALGALLLLVASGAAIMAATGQDSAVPASSGATATNSTAGCPAHAGAAGGSGSTSAGSTDTNATDTSTARRLVKASARLTARAAGPGRVASPTAFPGLFFERCCQVWATACAGAGPGHR